MDVVLLLLLLLLVVVVMLMLLLLLLLLVVVVFSLNRQAAEVIGLCRHLNGTKSCEAHARKKKVLALEMDLYRWY